MTDRRGTPVLMRFYADAFVAHVGMVRVNSALHGYRMSVTPDGGSDTGLLDEAIRAIGTATSTVGNSRRTTEQILREPNLPAQLVEDFDLHLQWCDTTLEDLDLCSSVIRYLVMVTDDYTSVLAQALTPYYRMMGIDVSGDVPGDDGVPDHGAGPQSDASSQDDVPDDLGRQVEELRRLVLTMVGTGSFVSDDDGIDDGPIEGTILEEDGIDDGPIIGPMEDDDYDAPVIGMATDDGGFVIQDPEVPFGQPAPSRPVLRPMDPVTGFGPIRPPAPSQRSDGHDDVPRVDDQPVDTYHQPPAPESDYSGLFGYDMYDEPDQPQPLAEDPVRLAQVAERASEVITAARRKAGRAATKSPASPPKGRGKASTRKTTRSTGKGTTRTRRKETGAQGPSEKPVTDTPSEQTQEEDQ